MHMAISHEHVSSGGPLCLCYYCFFVFTAKLNFPHSIPQQRWCSTYWFPEHFSKGGLKQSETLEHMESQWPLYCFVLVVFKTGGSKWFIWCTETDVAVYRCSCGPI